MIKIKYIIIMLFVFCFCIISNIKADDNKSYKCEGNTYSSTGGQNANSKPVATGFTWKDTKGNVYPIYISANGSCYVIKTSKKTNKEYRQYLGPEISQDVCKKLNREYKGKKNEK